MKTSSRGFSLVEMAVVLLIIGLLMAGMLMPLSTQVEDRRIKETQETLEGIKEALIGFAVANGRLPRPATSATDGNENPTACASDAACTGFIPWTTLGVAKLDSWGKIIRYSVTPAFTTTFTLSTPGTKAIETRDSAGALIYLVGSAGCTGSPCSPAVVFSHGKNNWGTDDAGNALADASATNADEDTNNGASVTFISRMATGNTAAAGGEFDDIVTWLSPNVLFNRMVAAGRLP
jgi:prepilin-type N-terminal cleavage/methylation domain-containing protein